MAELIRKRRGAAAVMITMLFVSISAVLLIIFGVSLRYSAANTADAVLYDSCRTLLSFYDRELQERYGIFGLEASESEMEKLVEQYMKNSMSAASYKRSELESIGIESAAFSLADTDNLSAQLTGIMKYMILDTGFDEFSSFLTDTLTGMSDRENLEEMIENEKESMAAAEEAQRERDDEDDSSEKIDFTSIRRVHKQLEESKKAAEEQEPELSEEDTVLRNCRVKDSLPSAVNNISRKGAFDGSGTFKYFTSGKKGLESAYENFMIDEYVLHYFSDYMDSEHEGFFSNEAEYVLYGDTSDKKNAKKTYKAIWKIREALNIVSIYKSTTKKEAALALANELTPGPWSVLTQQIILLVWSSIETSNDMKNLYDGQGVPLIKNDSTWMTDIGGIMEGGSGDGYLKIPGNSGMDYENYLRILLMTEERDVKLYRVMDLIQLNMKGIEREEFTVADHFTGFIVNADIKHKSSSPCLLDEKFSLVQSHSYYDPLYQDGLAGDTET